MVQRCSEYSASIYLANEPPFRLGELEVRPATRQVVIDGLARTLEPRVMQVLVTLARADGAVVGRDELFERCWGGRIVGENAINRVISRIRNLATSVGERAFELETITKVGYRLFVRRAELEVAPQAPKRDAPAPTNRRLVLGGVAASAFGLAGFGSWELLEGDRRTEDARILCAKGAEAQRLGLPEQSAQAVAYFRQATEMAPGSPEAWGGLALAYQQLMDGSPDNEQGALAARCWSAARRSLTLDRRNADAAAALVLVRPSFRRLAAIEADCEAALRRAPGHPPLEAALAKLLWDGGRLRAAIPIYRRLLSKDPFSPCLQNRLAMVLWNAGELEEAENLFDKAIKLWPGHRNIWIARVDFLTLTGRPRAAIAAIADQDTRPINSPRSPLIPFDLGVAVARAIDTRSPADADTAVSAILAARAKGEVSTINAVLHLSALGAINAAFGQLQRYYFGASPGGWPPKPGPLSRRWTSFLFAAAAAPLRADRRFPALTRALGLDDYWRATRSRPDYLA